MRTYRVLHLEDDPYDAELVRERLSLDSQRHWEISHVLGRHDFEEALDSGTFDLIIVDHRIAGYDGFLALDTARDKRPAVPVIVVTGELSDDDALRYTEAGAADYVLKQRLQRLSVAAQRAVEGATEHRQRLSAEHELDGLARRFHELAENSRDGFWFVSLEPQGFTYYSPAVERIWGVPVSSFYADARARLRMVHPDEAPGVLAAYDHWVSGKSANFEQEYRILRPDGDTRWIHDSGTQVRDASGHLLRLSGVVRDVTQRKADEAQIRVLNASLERKVAERTFQLQAANRELEAFSFSVSHDLTAPLRVVGGYAAILQRDHAGQLDVAALHLVSRMVAGCGRMEELIAALLRLSKLSRADFEPIEVNLTALAEEMACDIRERESSRNCLVRVAPNLRVLGDPRLLRIVLENLLSNACKFTARTANPDIEVGARIADGALRTFYVRDNGAGFDGSLAHRLFAPFHRLHRAEDFEGTGIGLATVRRIIERHGGIVWAEGEVGAGASVYFTLPHRDRCEPASAVVEPIAANV